MNLALINRLYHDPQQPRPYSKPRSYQELRGLAKARAKEQPDAIRWIKACRSKRFVLLSVMDRLRMVAMIKAMANWYHAGLP
jgi:hypothetical protein